MSGAVEAALAYDIIVDDRLVKIAFPDSESLFYFSTHGDAREAAKMLFWVESRTPRV